MMLLDGKPVNSCSYLALQAVDKEILTVEGLAGTGTVCIKSQRILSGTRWSAVRLLHAWDADLGERPFARQRGTRPNAR